MSSISLSPFALQEDLRAETMPNSALHPKHPKNAEILISEVQLQARIREMAQAINEQYQDCEKLVIISILKGSFVFLADLIRHISLPCQIEFVRLSSYENQTTSSGTVKPMDLSLPSLADEHVLLVEDIIDSGLTLNFFMEYLHSLYQTKSLRLAVLLDKPKSRNRNVPSSLTVDFTGFIIGNEFVIGYGLDYNGYYRNLPYIAVIPENSLPERNIPTGP